MKRLFPWSFVWVVLPVVVLLVCVLATFQSKTAADDNSPWLSAAQPTFTKMFGQDAGTALPDALSTGDRECARKMVTTRPATRLQTAIQNEYCFVETPYGDIADGTYLHFNGTKVAGKIANYPGYLGTYGIPSSLDAFNLKSTALGRTFHLTKHVSGSIATETAFDGQITYRLKNLPDENLVNGDGTPFYVIPTSMSFSGNGQWMVTDTDSSIGLIKVNLDTLQVLPFGHSSGSGIAPGAQTAVSNDGRYAVVTSAAAGIFRIYDLSTCDSSVPVVITGSVTCQSRDLWPDAAAQISGFKGPLRPKFISGDSLSFYTNIGQNSTIQYAKYNLYAPGFQPQDVTYLAMGDSFASGEGDNEGTIYYEPGTDVDVNKCHLSRRSYPYLIDAYLGLNDFHSVACSGAETKNFIGVTKEDIQYPLSSENTALGNWVPGSKTQIEYIDSGLPKFLTASIGGNDVGFADKLIECMTSKFKLPIPTTCKYAANPTERGNVAKEIANQFENLKTTYEELSQKTNDRTRVYIIGYPQFVKGTGGSCGANVHLNDEERYFVEQTTAYMNQVIRAAATSAGVHYVDVEHALEGHNLCSTVSDEDMAVNGVTLGNDIPNFLKGPIGNESYHPNPSGHELLKDKILALTNDDPAEYQVCPDPIQVICPSGSSHIPVPDVSYFGSEAVDYVEQINTLSDPNAYVVPTNQQLIVDSSPETGQLELRQDLLLPGSQATLVIESNPTQIGTYTVDSSGVLNEQITIPDGVDPGYHTLHLTAINIAGESVHYYEHIFVPGPEGDVDGNNTPDSEQACVFVQPSGQDQDMDGVDDACDSYIGPAPTPPTVMFLSLHDGDAVGGGNLLISADVQDERGVANVQFRLDGNNIGEAIIETPYTTTLDTTAISNGTHTLSITATNIVGLTTTIEEQINIYNLPPPPTIEITSPADGSTVSGTINITASAADQEGIADVQFLLNGENLGNESAEVPYAYSWDTKTATNEEHTISAVARSVNGQTTTTSVVVDVQNNTAAPIIQLLKLIINWILNWFKQFF